MATRLGVALAIVYAGIGVLWVLVSDGLALSIAPTAESLELVQRYKGFGFIPSPQWVSFSWSGSATGGCQPRSSPRLQLPSRT